METPTAPSAPAARTQSFFFASKGEVQTPHTSFPTFLASSSSILPTDCAAATCDPVSKAARATVRPMCIALLGTLGPLDHGPLWCEGQGLRPVPELRAQDLELRPLL